MVLTISASILLIISAKLQIPFWPIPITMQSLLVILIPLMVGLEMGLAVVSLYLAYGFLGLPVFAGTPEKGIGILYMVGPTGGYLLGFLFSTFVLGLLKDQGFIKNNLYLIIATLIGNLIIFSFGVLWLAKFVGFPRSMELGFFPFIYGGLFKTVLVVLVYNLYQKSLEKSN